MHQLIRTKPLQEKKMHVTNLKRPMLFPIILLAALWTTLSWSQLSESDETLFLAENHVSMEKMMAGMSVKGTGDVDQDFAEMMIPHHQGAIEMAQSELRYGKNEQLRRVAQEIIVEQQQEIAAMRLAINPPRPAPTASANP